MVRSYTILVIALPWVAISTAHAEQLYVADKLVLNVYSEANSGGSRVATIETGDSVEVIERVDAFVHVRLPDAREGWVGANYLMDQPPAIVRLKQLQNASPAATANVPTKQLTDEIARLQKLLSTQQTDIVELKKKLTAATKSAATQPQSTAPLTPAVHAAPEAEKPAVIEVTPVVVESNTSYWWLWMLALIAVGAVGFAAGYQTLGRRVRARFGGVKVY